MDSSVSYDLRKIKRECIQNFFKFSQRGLLHSSKWLAELILALKHVKVKCDFTMVNIVKSKNEIDAFLVARAFFTNQEYDRCAYYLRKCVSPICKFLHYYARYMSLEYKRIVNSTDDHVMHADHSCLTHYERDMYQLSCELKVQYINDEADGFLLYLYGVVLKKLDQEADARDVLFESVMKEPLNWSAWLELIPLVDDEDTINFSFEKSHWMKDFFVAHWFADCRKSYEASKKYRILVKNGFGESLYVRSQIALCMPTEKKRRSIMKLYKSIRMKDPFRMDCVDYLSNLLYVNKKRSQLACLARICTEIDRCSTATYFTVGNYFSLIGDHCKSIVYFMRALKMNPQYSFTWTSLGHEFVEVKNLHAAALCYRRAVETNKRDYRAWYGLGQTYENLQLSQIAKNYYKIAHKIKPDDCRPLMALGDACMSDEEASAEAIYYYGKVINMKEPDPEAFYFIGQLCQNEDEEKSNKLIAQMYSIYVERTLASEKDCVEDNKFAYACSYVVRYYLKRKNKLRDAFRYLELMRVITSLNEEYQDIMSQMTEKEMQALEKYMRVYENDQDEALFDLKNQFIAKINYQELPEFPHYFYDICMFQK